MVCAAAGRAHASAQNERLLVSLMALKRGELIADDAASYTPFHRHRDQQLTLDVENERVRGTLLVTVCDQDAGGVKVQTARLDRTGAEYDRREFTMYPFVDKAATRQEMVLIPVVHVADDGSEEHGLSTPIDLVITMKRVVRAR
jgi:hypothetical protein